MGPVMIPLVLPGHVACHCLAHLAAGSLPFDRRRIDPYRSGLLVWSRLCCADRRKVGIDMTQRLPKHSGIRL